MLTRNTPQTKFGKEGNCLVACISSITGIPIESIPNVETFFDCKFYDEQHDESYELWPIVLDSFLKGKGFKWSEAPLSVWNKNDGWTSPVADRPYLVIGKNFFGDRNHAVIYQDGQLIWDPCTKSPKGLSSIISVQQIIKF